MRATRRRTIAIGAAALGGTVLSPVLAGTAAGEDTMRLDGDTIATGDGDLVIHPVNHASVVLGLGPLTVYADPVGGAAPYAGLPEPDVIFVTHEHGDHFDPDTLTALSADKTVLVTNPAVFGMLPGALQTKATSMANGDSASVAGIGVDAIPAYNTTPERLNYHPEGRDNGYLLDLGGRRVYIAGDTEDIPEMRALTAIALAFVPMDGRFTMSMQQAASGVIAFAPAVVYPYHYRGADTGVFKALVDAAGVPVEVRLHDWYA